MRPVKHAEWSLCVNGIVRVSLPALIMHFQQTAPYGLCRDTVALCPGPAQTLAGA